MNYWLIKSEPNTYSWDDLVKLGKDHWDGVRNYQARNNIKAMKPGDLALFYHSVNEKSIVGIAECVSDFYQDPTTEDDRWVVVDFVPKNKLKNPVTLEQVKSDARLSDMVLVNNSRLSVQPVKKEEFDIILAISES
ncbi:EVE domain-containing protein [Roseivirga misakiensis]|uniref:Ubiquinol-cytochrome C reductase n=1 Tax=Roseivirga misakiensis TaxID=1563681 RepID=A0A1E5T2W5_9BACT|nr:EVE domain-containing protein [Roseivirga misakiensis]OEK05728.1 ubiquinol-cytochrome C reductase [Roseivirga misakiensis]